MNKCFVGLYFFLASLPGFSQQSPVFAPKPDEVSGSEISVINLCGTWDFSATPPNDFWLSPNPGAIDWKDIQVPGEWVMQGFEVKPGEMAAYHKEVEIPASWDKKLIFLKCDGLYSLSRILVNGQQAGSHQGGFTPLQLDLTRYMKPGQTNTIIIGLQNESLADTLASATQYAAHQLGGISRKLELFVLPEIYIKSLHYTTQVSDNYKDASVVIDMKIANKSGKDKETLELRAGLAIENGPSVLIPGNNRIPPVPAGGEIEYALTIPVRDARLWDPEHPDLYKSVIKLVEDGETIFSTSSKIGIREIEVVGNRVFVNGMPIKLKGVNRHEVHPVRGRSLTMDDWLTDARLFKEANVNYIRTSHYPPAEEFISICDSLGFFVECEAPLCWIGHGANSNWITKDQHDEQLYPLIRQMVLETVAHYRNHPSVIIWSMANESAWGPNWEEVLAEVNKADPSRPVSFHDQAYGGFNNFGSLKTQIANIHYPGPEGPDVARKFDRPLLFGEYAHLNTYNRQEIVTDPGVRDAWGRGLELMWENMYYSSGCLGGAIWSGIDDVFYLPSGKAVGYGEWGPIDGWRRPKPEYWHLKKIYSPVKVLQEKASLPMAIKVAVENRHLFTNLSEIDIRWKTDSYSGNAHMDLPPGATGILNISLPSDPGEGEMLNLAFWSPQGFMIDEYRLRIGDSKTEPVKTRMIKPELIVYENRVSVTSADEVWVINAVNGKLESVRKGDKVILTGGGPDLMLLPLKTGPCNTEHSLTIEPLNDLCTNWKGRVAGIEEKGNTVSVRVEGSYDEADINIVYWFGRSPEVEIEYEIVVKSDIDPRQIGLIFSMPRDFEEFSWERIGQWTVNPGTHIGRTSGTAIPFPNGKPAGDNYGEKPTHIWEEDFHPMGINDFRATRDKLVWGSLSDEDGNGIMLISDGQGAIRPYVENNYIKFLAAGFSTAGGDLFFSSHLRRERNPLKSGGKFKSKLKLYVY